MNPLSSPAPKWAVRAAHLAALVALPAGIWRLALALGINAGFTEQGYLAIAGSLEAKMYLVALSVLSEAFALLSLGLVRPWGEVVPRWIPWMGGREIRPMAVVVPASIGAVILLALWTPLLFWWTFTHDDMTATGHIAVGFVYLPLVAWGPLLAAVTVDFLRRHRRDISVSI